MSEGVGISVRIACVIVILIAVWMLWNKTEAFSNRVERFYCADFPTWEDAQKYFKAQAKREKRGQTFDKYYKLLDGDKDGSACDLLKTNYKK